MMRNVFILIIALPLFMSAQNSGRFSFGSQNIFTRSYTTEDGLPSNEVYSSLQDTSGNIWFATDLGVSRYNGYEFINYNFDATSLDNAILKLYKDYSGKIWFISLNGHLAYYEDGEIKPYEHNDKLASFLTKRGVFSSFYVDRNNNIDFAVRGVGIIKITANDSVYLQPYPERYDTDTTTIYIEMEKEHINFYILKKKIPYITDKQRLIINNTNLVSFPSHAKHSSYFNYIQLSENNWLCTFYKWVILIKGDEVTLIDELPGEILCLEKDKENNYWFGMNKGAGCMKFDSTRMQKSFYLKGNSVSSILFDYQNNIWCTTTEKGVFYSQNSNNIFYLDNYSKDHSLADIHSIGDTVYALYMDASIFAIANGNVSKKEKLNLDYNLYWIKEYKKELYVGSSRYEGIYKLTQGGYEKIEIYNDVLKTNNVTIEETNDSLAIAVLNFPPLKFSKKQFKNWFEVNFGFRTECGLQTDEGIYIGNNNGIWLYNNEYIENVSEKLKISGRVLYLDENKNHDLIAATKESGLFIYTPDSTYHLTKKNGLSSNYMQHFSIEEDTVWCGTRDGINKVVLVKQNGTFDFKITYLKKKDGLISSDINKVVVQKDGIWTQTEKGVNKLSRNSFNHPLVSIVFNIDSVLVEKQLVPFSKKLVLNYRERNIKIYFTALDFQNNDHLIYYYKLNGHDNDWQSTTNRNLIFSSLPSGDYKLSIYASNQEVQSAVKKIAFSIATPWWNTKWAFLLFATFVVLLFVLIYKIRSKILIKKILKKEKIEREKIELKLKALRAQMNPHFMFNSLNSILHYILSNDVNAAAKYLSKFSKLIRSMLQNSEDGDVRLDIEITNLNLYLELEQLRLENRFDFTITNRISNKSNSVLIPTLLIQPIIENAIWHGVMKKKEKGKIEILFEQKDKDLICTVSDNGIGRKANLNKTKKLNANKSLGISITKERLNILHSHLNNDITYHTEDLYLENGIPAGTKVTLKMPLVTL